MVERVRSFFSRNLGEAVFGCYDDAPAAPGLVSQYRNLQHHFVHLTNAGPASTFWAGCGAVLQKVFKDVGGFSEDFRHPSVEDIELGMRLTSAGHRIVLDANLRGKHLKSWSLPGMWVNDFQCRAVPWSRLILAGGAMPAGLNTGWASRLAVVAQGLSLVASHSFLSMRPFWGLRWPWSCWHCWPTALCFVSSPGSGVWGSPCDVSRWSWPTSSSAVPDLPGHGVPGLARDGGRLSWLHGCPWGISHED